MSSVGDGSSASSVALHEDAGALELRLHGPSPRVLRLELDPRDLGEVLWFDASVWTAPSGVAIDVADREALLDALATRAPKTPIAGHGDGFDVLLRAPADRALVGAYATSHDEGYATLLTPGRTARVDVRLRFPRGLAKALLLEDTAELLHPERRALDASETEALALALQLARREDFYRGERWAFERDTGMEEHHAAAR